MSHTATRSTYVLFVFVLSTDFFPIHLFFNQFLQHLTYFMIVVHKNVFVKTFQKLIHALALQTIDQEK